MDLRQCEFFLAIVESGGYRSAAETVNLSQSALSRQIQQLEETLGTELFDRSHRGVHLTPAGEAFQDEARLLLAAASRARDKALRAARGFVGTLKIGFVGPVIYSAVPKVLRVFREKAPEVDVELVEMQSGLQLEALLKGTLDIGFRAVRIQNPSIKTHVLVKERVALSLPAFHPKASLDPLDLSELADEPFILPYRWFEPVLFDMLVRMCHKAGFTPNIAHQANGAFNILGLVSAGLGVAFMPGSLTDLIQVQGVVFREMASYSSRFEQGIAWNTNNANPCLPLFVEAAQTI